MDSDVTLVNGVNMPLVGFGLYKMTAAEMPVAVEAAVDAGYRLFDTAQVYKNERHLANSLRNLYSTDDGVTDEIDTRDPNCVESWNEAAPHQTGSDVPPSPPMQQRRKRRRRKPLSRSDLFITSKLHPRNQSFEGASSAVRDSLTQLETDFIDLYLIHWPGTTKLKPEDPQNSENRRRSWEALEKIYEETNSLRAIGVSNFTPQHLRHLLEEATVRPAVLQSEFHPRLFQDHILHFCHENKIQFQAYSSLGTSSPSNQLLEDNGIIEIAKKYEKSAAQVLLKFALQHDALIIPKSTNPAHILDNTLLFDFELSARDIEMMEEMNDNHHFCWNPDIVC